MSFSYKGQYMDDKKHGYGEFIWPDGKKYKVFYHFYRANGLTANNMDKDIIAPQDNLKNRGSGLRGRELNGWIENYY